MVLGESTSTETPLRVLLVDDDAGIRSVLRRQLESDGHYVETAGDGLQGLEQFKEGSWDVVITDRVMPRLNGDGLAKAIKQIDPTVKIILVAGFADRDPDPSNEGSSFDVKISKPFKYETLRAAIGSLGLRKDH